MEGWQTVRDFVKNRRAPRWSNRAERNRTIVIALESEFSQHGFSCLVIISFICDSLTFDIYMRFYERRLLRCMILVLLLLTKPVSGPSVS